MSDHVMVFAPTPHLTVTIEGTDTGPEVHLHPGAQGIWQARMVRALQVPVTVCAALGGEVGLVLDTLLSAEGFVLRAVTARSGSGWYVHDRRGGTREVIADGTGPLLTRHELDELYNVALIAGLRGSVSLLSGPPPHPAVPLGRQVPGVPVEMYRRLAADLSANGSQVIADLSGEYLEAVLAAGVGFLKVSHEELIRDGRVAGDSIPELVEALRALRADGARAVVISRAGAPALALVEDEMLLVHPPRLEVVEHRGAGDSMTAGVAAVLARGGDLRRAIRTGAAAGALNVTRHGLGSGRADAIRELTAHVRLEPLEPTVQVFPGVARASRDDRRPAGSQPTPDLPSGGVVSPGPDLDLTSAGADSEEEERPS